MCIALPARVTEVHGAVALVERGDGRPMRATTLLLPDVRVGDWVVVTSGTIVERLSRNDARQLRDALAEAIEADARDEARATSADW
jgi:hydrogenase assembly chaperone HypC/HupF